MTPRHLLLETARRFRKAGIPDPETDAALLLSSLCGVPPLVLRLDTETQLDAETLSRFESLADRRLQRIPLQYLLGETFFCGRRFKTDERALIPRPETELLCARACEWLSERTESSVLDVCCGSGCIGLTLKAEFPSCAVTLSDISAEALSLASENAELLSLDVTLRLGDLLEEFPDYSFDLIVCNPPYIPSGECPGLQEEVHSEPLSALDGGADGLFFYRRLAETAPRVLTAGGALMMELGAGESPAVRAIMKEFGYRDVEVRKDFSGIERIILGFTPEGGKMS